MYLVSLISRLTSSSFNWKSTNYNSQLYNKSVWNLSHSVQWIFLFWVQWKLKGKRVTLKCKWKMNASFLKINYKKNDFRLGDAFCRERLKDAVFEIIEKNQKDSWWGGKILEMCRQLHQSLHRVLNHYFNEFLKWSQVFTLQLKKRYYSTQTNFWLKPKSEHLLQSALFWKFIEWSHFIFINIHKIIK